MVRAATAEEAATLLAFQQSETAAQAARDTASAERTTATADVRDQYAAAITALDAIIARNGTFTLAQASQALDALAKGQKRLLRLLKAQVG